MSMHAILLVMAMLAFLVGLFEGRAVAVGLIFLALAQW